MTREQKRLVRDSYESIKEVAGPLALLFYGRLFQLDPSTRQLFPRDLKTTGGKLMDTLASVVDSLDDFEQVRPRLVELGRKHLRYGVRASHYDSLASALEWALVQAGQTGFDTETRAAWRIVIGLVNQAMKSVYTESASAES